MKILITSVLRRKLTAEITASRVKVIYNLVDGLLKRGHEVAVLAPGSSYVAGASIINVIDESFVDLPPFENQFYTEIEYLVLMARKMQDIAHHYDIIHNHTYPEQINLLLESTLSIPMVTTLHAPATPDLDTVLSAFPESNIVAQSKAYRDLLPNSKIKWVIHNGINTNLFNFSTKPRDYLLWVGRLGSSKDAEGKFIDGKGVKDAIAVARKTGKKLILMGNAENIDSYYRDVHPFLSDTIKWISPLSSEQPHPQHEVRDMMHGAKALLFPTKFEEAFGLVAAEALACGTPVIGYAHGSVSEIVEDGKTGYLVNASPSELRGRWCTKKTGTDGLSEAVKHIYSLDSHDYGAMQIDSRERSKKYFDLETMITNYENLYTQLIKERDYTSLFTHTKKTDSSWEDLFVKKI